MCSGRNGAAKVAVQLWTERLCNTPAPKVPVAVSMLRAAAFVGHSCFQSPQHRTELSVLPVHLSKRGSRSATTNAELASHPSHRAACATLVLDFPEDNHRGACRTQRQGIATAFGLEGE